MNLKNFISLVLCVCIANICFGQNPRIDSSFGENGRVRPRFDRKPIYEDIYIDKKNRIMLKRDTLVNGSDYATVFYRYNTNGQPDLTFNGSGRLIVNIEIADNGNPYNYEQAGNVLFLNDHRITFDVQMQFSNSLWIRLNENGGFDTQFGTNGKLLLPSGYDGYNTNVTTDNKFITSSLNFGQLKISKYNTNGNPDNSFGTSGVRTINIGNIGAEMEYVDNMLIDASGNLFVIGENSKLEIVKLNPNGTIHTNYGTNGLLEYYHETAENESLYFWGSQLSADGKILTNAYDDIGNNALVRFTTAGVPDNTFGTNGLLLLPYLGGDKVFDNFATSPSGAIWLCGIAKEQNYYRYLVSKRLNNGSVDNSFGNNGYLTYNINNQDAYSEGIIEITGGKLLVVGHAMQDQYYGTTMLQLLPNGALDNSYGSNGKLHITGVDPNRTNDSDPTTSLSDLVAGPDNTILYTGYYEEGGSNYGSFFVSSLSENGTIVNSFGNNGFATISPLYGNGDGDGKIVRQPDGKIVVAHMAYDLFTDGNSILLQRLTATGQPDENFGTLGRILIPFGPDDNLDILDLKAAPNGKLGLLIEYYDISDKYKTEFYQFTANGLADYTMSSDGKLIPDFNAYHLAFNSQNKIILLGERYIGEGEDEIFENMFIQQFNDNGTADNSFNGGNMRAIQLSGYDSPDAIIMEAGDNITIPFQPELDDKDYAIAKLGSNGLPLANWGINGIVAGNSGSNYWDISLRLDNGGYLFVNDNNIESKLQLFKTTPSGKPDSSFANNGRALININNNHEFLITGIVLKPGGKLIVGGNEYNSQNNDSKREILIAQININAPSNTIYTITNPGNWSNPANWQTGQVPPSTITPGMEIIINPGGNGIATLDINVIVQLGGKITVMPGKRLNVNAMLTVPSIQ